MKFKIEYLQTHEEIVEANNRVDALKKFGEQHDEEDGLDLLSVIKLNMGLK